MPISGWKIEPWPHLQALPPCTSEPQTSAPASILLSGRNYSIYVQMITLVVLHYGYILLCILASATNNVKKVAWMVALVITYVYVPAFPVDYTIQKHFFEKEN